MKKFLVIGSITAYSYKEIFPLVKFNKMYIGYLFDKVLQFTIPCSSELKKMCGIAWYQSLKKNIVRPKIELTKHYNPIDYPKYDNYDAIEVSKVKDIPMDYTGLMGVPITFLNKYNPKQFEIVGLFKDNSPNGDILITGTPVSIYNYRQKYSGPVLNGKAKYIRLIIKNKHPVVSD